MRNPSKKFSIRNKDGTLASKVYQNLRTIFLVADKLSDVEVVDGNNQVQIRPDFSTPYGYCPECQAEVVSREKCFNGNDICAKGHHFLAKFTLQNKT